MFKIIKVNDRNVLKNLKFLIDNKSLSSLEVEFELICFKSRMIEQAIIVFDLNLENVFYNQENEKGYRLIYGNYEKNKFYIKLKNLSNFLASIIIKRVWKRFEKRHLQGKIKLRDFEWFFSPNAKCDADFFSFMNQHVDARLKNKLSTRHQLEYHDYKDKSYVFKRFSPSDNSDISRKIELSLKSFIISGAQRSFRGASWLQDACIPSIKPVAWTVVGKGYSQVSYFVYEKLECTGNVHEAIQSVDVTTDASESMLIHMGQITRKIHEAGLRHTDIVAHNFLYKDKGDDFDVYVIDTDKMEKAKLIFPSKLKLFFDLRCLRRLKLSKRQTEVFFNAYFDEQLKGYYFKMWKFWLAGGWSLPRRFKKNKDKKIKKLLKIKF